MKKFISLALAAAMTLSLVPVSAFASTDNRISNVITVEKDTELSDSEGNAITGAPSIQIKDDKGDITAALKNKKSTVSFEVVLDGAEWVEANLNKGGNDVKVYSDTKGTETADLTAKIEKLTSTRALVTLTAADNENARTVDNIVISLEGTKVTGDTAKVTIDPKNSTVSADTFTFAKSVNGSTITTVEKTVDVRDTGVLKDIIIEETVANTFKANEKITLKLNSGFKFVKSTDSENAGNNGYGAAKFVSKGTTGAINGLNIVDGDARTIEVSIKEATDVASIIRIAGLTIAEDGAKVGDVAEITVSGAGVEKTTVEVAKLVDYGTSVSVANKDLPTIYSGSTTDGDDNETLLVTVEETTANSWLLNRKTTFTFPEGVKVNKVTVDKDTEYVKKSATGIKDTDFVIDGNEVSFSGFDNTTSNKAKLVLKFDLVVAPDFTGDIKCTVGGAALDKDAEVTVAKAVAPVTVEAAKTSVAIDYRNVAVGDITVKEAEAGLWEKDQTIILKAENMQFESGIKAEVAEGDGEIKDLTVDKTNGQITITVKSESSKTPMTIKLTGVSLYLDRTLPAGDYSLDLVKGTNAVLFENYNEKDGNDPSKSKEFGFDVDSVEVMKDYVTVATSGRDQGTTFTTTVAVTIDSTTMLVDGAEKTLDVPAYLSAEGWTMLPVRAVTEALATASNSQPIDWIAGNPGTIMIYYGDKTVAMTLGSTTMYINGTPVPMSTAPVIVNDRAFLPMRDLGRALGLSDDQIAWDAATRTATFNPAK